MDSGKRPAEGRPPMLRPLPRKIIDSGHGLFPLYPLILKIVLTSSSSLSSQVISMGQRKDSGMSFAKVGSRSSRRRPL
jgi:hypothetical protein